ncbi:MAG: hypothetical protein NT154_02445, partial [Verrucomicrobia bacterium]|nr:hypothetical protein [Verrucomicrobiota bacterium]
MNQTVAISSGSTTPASATYIDTTQAGSLQFTSSTYPVNENEGAATLSVTRIGGSSGAVSAQYATANGTAVAPGDYATTSGTLSWASGDTAPKTITVPIVNDSTPESSESFTVTLFNPTGGATLGTPAAATVTIADDDPPPAGALQFAQGDYPVNENEGTVTLSVTRIGGSYGAVSVQYATANGTAVAPDDYTTRSGTLNWADGDTDPKPINVPIVNDSTPESIESFTVTLSNPTGGASLDSLNTTTVTIVDDDSATRIIGVSGNLAFGDVVTNTTATHTLTITNSGNSTLAVSSIDYPPSGFSGNWSGTIPAGDSTDVTVTFAPMALTNYAGTVRVNSDATSGGNTIIASGVGTVVPPPQAGGLVAYCPLDGDANDASGNGNNGTNVNCSVTSDRHAAAGGALWFNGIDSYVDILSLNTNPVITLCAWVRPETGSADTEMAIITGDNGGYDRALMLSDDGSIEVFNGNQRIKLAQTLPFESWSHVALVFSSSDIILYVNGILAWQNGAPASGWNEGNWRIGRTLVSGGQMPFKGAVDDVRICGRALSGPEVGALAGVAYVHMPISVGLSSASPILTWPA